MCDYLNAEKTGRFFFLCFFSFHVRVIGFARSQSLYGSPGHRKCLVRASSSLLRIDYVKSWSVLDCHFDFRHLTLYSFAIVIHTCSDIDNPNARVQVNCVTLSGKVILCT